MEFLRKKRKICQDPGNSSCGVLIEAKTFLPTLESSGYYMKPCLKDLVNLEAVDPGYCSRVRDFTVGRFGYGCVKFLGETDVRWLNLDQIIKFRRHEVVVYKDEKTKPAVGWGLNKPAEVTLMLRINLPGMGERRVADVKEMLMQSTKRQGARFISFDPFNCEWKFLVCHFSRFGLSEDDEEDMVMDDATALQQPEEMDDGEVSDIGKESPIDPSGSMLSHSLPAHLGLDPIKMKEMKMLMFPAEEEGDEDFGEMIPHQKRPLDKEYIRPSMQHASRSMIHRSSPPVLRKTPLALIEYNPGNFDSNSPGNILMAQQNKGANLKTTKSEGFKLELKHETPIAGSHSHNVVDAALFMGRSFRVGWGPNGVLVHSGAPVDSNDPQRVFSSIIHLEKIAIDKVARDENNKASEELVNSCFDAPLNLHKAINHETKEVEVGSFKLKLQKLVCNRLMLSEICRSYIGIVERHLEVPGLSSSAHNVLMHQVMVWELIKVLFADREYGGQSKSVAADNEEDMMHDTNEVSPEVDVEALPLIRRAQFSCWLQESVCHRVQNEISYLNESNDLEQIFLLLTGRQLNEAVELAASRGDVRLACLLSQAGGSMVNRSDVSRQLDIWVDNGLDFNFIEKERLWIYKLLSADIHGALHARKIDWKRFLGLLLWYRLPPDTPLPVVFHTYQQLINITDTDLRAPYPVPIYIDEGPVEEAVNWCPNDRFDLAYYIMLLHANEDGEFGFLKTMFSAFSSTHDPLDYHMIWHQRAVLEAVGAFSSNDLHVLDMGLVSQLLCLGQCHWAIYVVLHMPHRDDYPYLQATLIREILFQYCETWSSQEKQHKFIEDLGVPSEWLHEAMAVYYNYYGDLSKALEHFIECANWPKAHLIFVTSVAHSLFLSDKHSEIWMLATSMENHKSEIEDWDLGAGIYMSFYQIRNSLQEDNNTMSDLDSLNSKNSACRDFFTCLNESLAVWGSRLPVDARVAYSKMAEEICELLLSDSGEGSMREDLLSCYDTMTSAPIPEDLRSCHLQDAVTLYTQFLSEIAS